MFNNNNDEEELNFDKNQTKNINNNNNIDDDIDDTNNNDNNDNDDNDETISTTKRRKNNTSRKSKLANKPMRLTGASGAVGDEKRDEHDTSLHQQQQHTLALENRDLLGMLRNDVDQARGLEQSVAKIGTLQRVFATKLSEQAEQISHIHHTIVGATDAVSRGNDQLAQAAAHGVDFRVFVLLFLLVCSFALIFLDNYEWKYLKCKNVKLKKNNKLFLKNRKKLVTCYILFMFIIIKLVWTQITAFFFVETQFEFFFDFAQLKKKLFLN